MVGELVDRILLVRPSPKASCGAANLDLSGCPNCRRHFARSTDRLVAVRSSVVATWLPRHVRAAGDHVNRPLLHLVGAHPLGRLWSGVITHKEGHKIIDRGPYAFIRHPIYTGLVVALFATAAVEATVPALLGAALMIFGFWLKARSEQQFLRIELGPEFYRAYCRRVPMIVPFITPGERASRRPRANQ
jgi:protein-S-isoprenylcysteine O-methyltransferase Ste14